MFPFNLVGKGYAYLRQRSWIWRELAPISRGKLMPAFPGGIVREYVPTENGGHTTYTLFRVDRSNKVRPFPASNFQLATPKHREQEEASLRHFGLKLSLEPVD